MEKNKNKKTNQPNNNNKNKQKQGIHQSKQHSSSLSKNIFMWTILEIFIEFV